MLLSAQQVEVHVHQDSEANVIGADEIMCLWLKEKCENEVYLTVCQDEWNKHTKMESKSACVLWMRQRKPAFIIILLNDIDLIV